MRVDEKKRADEPVQTDVSSTATTTTLGDVLFAKSSSPTAESEWLALIQSIAARDTRALRALYNRTHKIVFTLIMRITRNPQAAEELTLDVFHDVWRRASSYNAGDGSVIGWLLNQARSRAIDRLRYDNRKKRVEPATDGGGQTHQNDHATGEVTTTTIGPHEALEHEQRARRLHDALGKLTSHEREAIEMAFFSGLTHAETATKLDQPLGTVKTRIRAGLEKLRAALAEEEGAPR